MPITIVESPLWSCRKCKSVLQDNHCKRCNITYLPVEYYRGNDPVTNPEECMEIYRRRISQFKSKKAKARKSLREMAAEGYDDLEDQISYIEDIDREINDALKYFAPPPNLASPAPRSKNVVYVYHQFTNSCVTNRHPIEAVTVKTIDARSKRKVDVNAYYCKKCERCFINAEVLNKDYYSRNLFPLLNYDLANVNPSSLKEFSELYILGYSVKEGILTCEERQQVLAEIIENGLMGKEQIIRKLQFLVRFNGSKPENSVAKEKWQADILFVSQYTSDNKRRIEPVFIRK